MPRIPKLIITTGEPAGIGVDLCVILAFKKVNADITIIGNKKAIIARAKNIKRIFSLLTKKVCIKEMVS